MIRHASDPLSRVLPLAPVHALSGATAHPASGPPAGPATALRRMRASRAWPFLSSQDAGAVPATLPSPAPAVLPRSGAL